MAKLLPLQLQTMVHFGLVVKVKRRVYKGYYYDNDEIHVYHIAEFTRKSCGRTRIGQIHNLAHQFFSQTLNYFAFLFAMQLSETACHQR